MSSWVYCPCGKHLHTNLGAGAKVSLVVLDEVFDRLEEPSSTADWYSQILRASDTLVRCPVCGRIGIKDRSSHVFTFYEMRASPSLGEASESPPEKSEAGLKPNELRCPMCKTIVPAEANFCPRCGWTWIDEESDLRCSQAEALGRITAKGVVKTWGFGEYPLPVQIDYGFTGPGGETVVGSHVGPEISFHSVEVGDRILIRYLASRPIVNAPRDALGLITRAPGG